MLDDEGPFVLNGYGSHYERIVDQYVLRISGAYIELTRSIFKTPRYDSGKAVVSEPKRGDSSWVFARTARKLGKGGKGGKGEGRWFKLRFEGDWRRVRGQANPPHPDGVKVYPELGRFLWL